MSVRLQTLGSRKPPGCMECVFVRTYVTVQSRCCAFVFGICVCVCLHFKSSSGCVAQCELCECGEATGGVRGSGLQAVSIVMNYIDFTATIQCLFTATLSTEGYIKLLCFLTIKIKKFLHSITTSQFHSSPSAGRKIEQVSRSFIEGINWMRRKRSEE